jgi:predicted metal-dependent phosphoesterase TrpH
MVRDPGTGGRVKIDMHVHTSGSFDCLSDPQSVVTTALERGLDRICITDHNEIDVALGLRRLHPERIIVGEEIKTAERVDIIGLYLTERIPKGTPAVETCERIHGQGGIVYVPHPFAAAKGSAAVLGRIEKFVDAFEGFNARIHDPALNDRATAWARQRGVPVGAGSDAHTLREIGRAWVELPAFADEPAALLAALHQGALHGRLSSHAVHLASTWAKVRKRLPLSTRTERDVR